MSETFSVLAVCTGNICRSPAMERLLAQIFRDEPNIEVNSAGTYAHDGEDMQEAMKQRLADYGADTEDFTAQQVTPSVIDRAHIILTATREHVADMAAEVPAARPRMFTLPEFARLLQSTDAAELDAAGDGKTAAETLAALVPQLNQARRRVGAATREDDVVDPYMLPESVFDTSFRQIRQPVELLARTLGVSH
ncbi:low molecular weight phosphatase family protein [Nesterenkonia natronophila]|uniref:arsenate reductase/protein-tyrosine-phosphatase family protein n=1 Tax=Nesterenkonia natronophila TaxID=2174932 RepID=UPI001314337E|nr:low molecular weight phosphatase family protein [Nesterenkonia natronophila]